MSMAQRGQTGAGKRVQAPARSVAGACGRPSEGRAWAAAGTAARGGAGDREAEAERDGPERHRGGSGE